MSSLGILVFGDSHLIVRGAKPSPDIAVALVRRWSVIHIGGSCPVELAGWSVVERAFREDLEWAVVVGDQAEMGAAVATLLGELRGRGVTIHLVQGSA